MSKDNVPIPMRAQIVKFMMWNVNSLLQHADGDLLHLILALDEVIKKCRAFRRELKSEYASQHKQTAENEAAPSVSKAPRLRANITRTVKKT